MRNVVIVFGDAPAVFLRARACENRVFLVRVNDHGWNAFDPRGLVVREEPWRDQPDARIVLDASQAASKTVAPRTDVLAGRRPAQYDFTDI